MHKVETQTFNHNLGHNEALPNYDQVFFKGVRSDEKNRDSNPNNMD